MATGTVALLPGSTQEIADQAGRTAMAEYGTGSDLQRAIQAATAAPYVAEVIGHRSGLENGMEKAAAHAVANATLAAMQGQNALAGAAGAVAGELAGSLAKEMYGKDVADLSESQRQTISALATIAAGIAGGLAGDGTAAAVTGAQNGKVVVENHSLSLVARGCAVAALCRTKVAEQLLEIGAKAGVAGIAGAALKDVAEKMTSDELEHLVTLQMMGNDEVTGKYLSSLQDKYAPSHTGGNHQPETSPDHTGNNTGPVDTGPNHTGNNNGQVDSGPNHTGNIDGVPDTGGNTTVTPIPDEPNKDDIAYLALKGKKAQEAANNLGFDRRIPPQKAPFDSHGQPVYFNGKPISLLMLIATMLLMAGKCLIVKGKEWELMIAT